MVATDREIDEAAARSVFELLARERRGRLSAERRMAWMRAEMMRAHASLDAHARHLAEQLGPLRREAEAARGEVGRVADEARLAASRLHDAFEVCTDGFAIWDSELRLVDANATYLAPFDELEEVRAGIAYRRVLELAADEGIVDIGMSPLEAWVDMMIGRATAEAPEAVVLQLWDGTCKRLTHRRTANGDLVSLAVDITEALQREAELEEERHRAEGAARAKQAFLSNMSHELRTPLGGILGMARLLAEEELTDDQREQLAVIEASGEALLAIVDDVLDLGRIEGEHLALRPAPFEPRAVVDEVSRALRPLAVQRGLAFEATVADAVPTRLLGDAARLRQVLANLLGNAVKFTEAGRVSLELEEAERPAPGVSRLAVAVEDTGIGIAEDDLWRIFAPFEQAETDRSRSHDGAGLSLTVARRLLGLMGGELWVVSEPGRGSRFGFSIDLPVADGADAEEGTPATEEASPTAAPGFGQWRARGSEAAPAEARRGPSAGDGTERTRAIEAPAAEAIEPVGGGGGERRMRVLAAEDNAANRLILTRMLAGLDLDLTVVEDGAEAVEAFEREGPDLILMDISMPRMDGTEATRRIRAAEGEGSRVPIVAMTAHALAGDEDVFRAAGLDAYLPKPMRKSELRAHVLAHVPEGVRSPGGEAG